MTWLYTVADVQQALKSGAGPRELIKMVSGMTDALRASWDTRPDEWIEDREVIDVAIDLASEDERITDRAWAWLKTEQGKAFATYWLERTRT